MEGLLACCACPQGPALSQAWRYEQSRLSARTWSLQAGCEWLVWACCDRRPPSTLWGFAPKGILLAVHAIAARMAAQRGLGLFRAAEESSRGTVEAGQPRLCFGMCSGSTAEQLDCRAASLARGRRPGRAAPARRVGDRFWGQYADEKKYYRKAIERVRRAHPWATPPCKRRILGALRGSVGAIHQYFGNGGSIIIMSEFENFQKLK